MMDKVLDYLHQFYGENIISVYGIGSYFDNSLPEGWLKNDMDLIVFVKSLEQMPKPHFSHAYFEIMEMGARRIFLGYTTQEAYQSKEAFEAVSFSNYKWSLVEIKYEGNSKLVDGPDLRSELPNPETIAWDYDDVLARGLYQMDKSYTASKEGNTKEAEREFSKGMFKLAYYLCVWFHPECSDTTLIPLSHSLANLTDAQKIHPKFYDVFRRCMAYRQGKDAFSSSLGKERNGILLLVFSMLANGQLHRIMKELELKKFLSESFSRFKQLIQFLEALRFLRPHMAMLRCDISMIITIIEIPIATPITINENRLDVKGL